MLLSGMLSGIDSRKRRARWREIGMEVVEGEELTKAGLGNLLREIIALMFWKVSAKLGLGEGEKVEAKGGWP